MLYGQKGTTMSFVTLNDITKQYHMGDITINANDKVSFDIEKGEFAIIVGPSGSARLRCLIYSAVWIPLHRAVFM